LPLEVALPTDGKPERLEQLLGIGRARGHVLYEEIDKVLSPLSVRETAADLDTILSELTLNSIDVVDEPRTEDSIPDEEQLEQLNQVHVGDSPPTRMYLREVSGVSRLTEEEEKALAKRISGGGQDVEEAEKQLIEANLWIALATATHYTNRGLRFLDLIQEGNISLMRAVKEYNYLRQYRFATYATWWVRKAIIRAIEDSPT
jgi:DNA-directed RNA polymerase sigma subunit (sigma70/sigma32)